jgi:hypothetical protein
MNATTAARPGTEPKPPRDRGWRDHLGWALSLFLVGLGAKLWLIGRSGTILPFWDAWDVEAVWLYIPYFEGNLSLRNLLHHHNEHRMFFTNLYCLALLLLNGQWDNQLQMVANAMIHSGTLAGLGWSMARLTGRKAWPFIWPPLALALVLPFAWENTLGGGLYTQFYFLLTLSLVAIWFMGLSPPLSIRWWAGVLAVVGTLLTAGSGFLVVGAIAGLAILEILKQPRAWKKHVPTFAISFLIGIAGMMLKVEIPVHKVLQAHTPMEFLIALANNLAWPWIVVPPYAAVNLFPLFLLSWMYLTSKDERQCAEKATLGIGGWMLLQCMAAAYARGAGGGLPFWRYMDTSSFIMITGTFSMVLLLTRHRERLWCGATHPWIWRAAAAAWVLVCAVGLWLLCSRALSLDIPEREFFQRMQLETTRAFLATDDLKVIADRPRTYRLRPDNAQIEADLLRNPIIQKILPACVRKPLTIVPDDRATHGFALNTCMPVERNATNEPWWGSCDGTGKGGPRVFESMPVAKSPFPFLEIPVAGYPGQGGTVITLEASRVDSGTSENVRPRKIPEAHWVDAIVPAPPGDFKIAAKAESDAKWLAFKEPRELGRLSYWSMRIVAAWKGIVIAGIVCLGISAVTMRRKSPEALFSEDRSPSP